MGELDGGRGGRTDRETETRKEATGRQLDKRELRQREKQRCGVGCGGGGGAGFGQAGRWTGRQGSGRGGRERD